MKKLFVCAVLGLLVTGCTSTQQTKTDAALTDQYSKYQILDQEFDNLTVTNDGYDQVAPYEEQVSTSTYIQSAVSRKGDKKPARTVTVQKTVVDGQGNVLSGDVPAAPVTDQEVLPDETAQ